MASRRGYWAVWTSAKITSSPESLVDFRTGMDVPYYVAAPLLLQDLASWRQSGVTGLQSVVIYALPELDGAVDAVVLGALEGDDIVLEPERVEKLCQRVARRVKLRNTPTRDRKVGLVLYGFPPNVGAVGTAALLNVPRSLDAVWISNIGRPTTSTRRCLRSCVCMAWSFQAIDATLSP